MNIIPYNREQLREFSLSLRILVNNYKIDLLEERADLIKKEKEIKVLIEKDKLDIIGEELDSFCKNEWKELILKSIIKINNEINFRETRGKEFADILSQLEKIEEDLIDITAYNLNEIENIYDSDIKYLRMDARERISNEILFEKQRKKIEEQNKKIEEQRKKYTIYTAIFSTILFFLGLLVQKFIL